MVNLYIQGKLLDQYNDESVDIFSSVLDVQDITKNTGDYSKGFTVPTSKRNNKIFSHWYNATIDGGFDARTRVAGTIDIDGVPFKSGKWLLRSVKMVKGVADSYEINFYGDTASVSEAFGEDALRDLDLSALNHTYNEATVRIGLSAGLYNEDIIYTPMSQQGMYFDSTPSSDDIKDADGNILLRNLSAFSNNGSGLKYNEIRPSVKVIKIIEAIESKYSLNFSRDFFSTTEFNDLYMWLSPNLDGEAIGNSENRIDWSTTNGTWTNTTTDIVTYVPTIGSTTDVVTVAFMTKPVATADNIIHNVFVKDVDTGDVLASRRIGGTNPTPQETILNVTIPLPTTRNIEYTISSTQQMNYVAKITSQLVNNGTLSTTEVSNTASSVLNASNVIVSKLLPEMKVTEFFKGIIQMFKLVVIGKGGDDIYINSLDAYYRTGDRFDISKYVNRAEFQVDRGEILSELSFKFQEPSTVLAKEFFDRNGVGYGDSKVKLLDANGDKYDGDTLTVDLPFEQIVYERLNDNNGGRLTGVQIANVIDAEYNPVFTKPHLHYATKLDVSGSGNKIKFTGGNLQTDMWIPMTHTGVYSPLYSLLFESEISTYTSENLNNTLYSNHYKHYIDAIFNIKRRTIRVEAKLPIQMITKLSLNDIITIDKLDYRMNNYSYNLLNGLTKLELINGFEEYEGNDVILPSECFKADNRGDIYTFNIPNVQNYTITSSVVGGGTAFVTPTVGTDILTLDVDAWLSIPVTEFSRRTNLTFTSQAGTPVLTEKIKDGSFANGNTDWTTVGANSWTIANGKATNDGSNFNGSSSTLTQLAVLPRPLQGATINLSVNITNSTQGRLIMTAGGTNHQFTVGNGIKTFTTTVSGNSETSLYSIDNFNGSVTDISMTVLEGGETVDEGGMCITQTNEGA